jgi:hypothetical protein
VRHVDLEHMVQVIDVYGSSSVEVATITQVRRRANAASVPRRVPRACCVWLCPPSAHSLGQLLNE